LLKKEGSVSLVIAKQPIHNTSYVQSTQQRYNRKRDITLFVDSKTRLQDKELSYWSDK